MQNNLAAFAERSLVPRVLQGLGSVSTDTTLLGQPHPLPLGIAPTGLTALMRSDAERAGARGAGTRGLPFTLSTLGTRSIESVAADAPTTRRWFQLYLTQDRGASLGLVERAKRAGYDSLVLTVDTTAAGRRLRDERNGMSMPPKLTARTALASALHPQWTLDLLRHDAPSLANFTDRDSPISQIVGSSFDPALSVRDLRWLRDAWSGNLIVKGILSPEDARLAVAEGADAIWVSNHGGRQLDQAVVPLDAVPAIRSALGTDATILMDSGVLSGTDVAIALASGADFIFIGRAYLYGLMAGGQRGVERVLDLIKDEFANTMQLLGAETVDDLDPSMLAHAR